MNSVTPFTCTVFNPTSKTTTGPSLLFNGTFVKPRRTPGFLCTFHASRPSYVSSGRAASQSEVTARSALGSLATLEVEVPLENFRVGEREHQGIDQGARDSEDTDAVNIIEIMKIKDHFRYHKIPKLKKLRLKLKPSLVLRVLKHKDVSPRNAWKFFVWAKKQMGYKHTGETCNTIIASLCEIRKFTSIYFLMEDMYKTNVSLTPETCMRMAKAFGKAGLVERAVHAVNHLKRLGSPATARHLNSLVVALLDGEHHYKAYIAYKELADAGCEPDSHTFKLLLRGLCKVEKADLACQVFDEMRAKGFEPDAEIASIMVVILCGVGRVEEADLLFENLNQKGIRVNARVYAALLDGFEKASKTDRALQIFEKMHTCGFYSSADSSAALLDLLVLSGRDADAQRCREYMGLGVLGEIPESN